MDAEHPKRRKLADFFPKLSQSEVSQLPGFLRQFQPTDVLRRPARPKRSVGRPRSLSRAESRTSEPCPSRDTENQQCRSAWKERASQEVFIEHTAFDRRWRSLSSRDRIPWALLPAVLHSDESSANVWLPDCLVNMVPTPFFVKKIAREFTSSPDKYLLRTRLYF